MGWLDDTNDLFGAVEAVSLPGGDPRPDRALINVDQKASGVGAPAPSWFESLFSGDHMSSHGPDGFEGGGYAPSDLDPQYPGDEDKMAGEDYSPFGFDDPFGMPGNIYNFGFEDEFMSADQEVPAMIFGEEIGCGDGIKG